MEKVTSMLLHYYNRDYIIRTCQYGSKLIAALSNSEFRNRFLSFSSALSNSRIIYRLFDDLLMLKHSMRYLQNQDKDQLSRFLGLIKTAADQLYFPIEHLAWCTGNGLIKFSTSAYWWALCIRLWACSLAMNFFRGLVTLWKLGTEKQTLCMKLSDYSKGGASVDQSDDRLKEMDAVSFEEKRSYNVKLKEIQQEQIKIMLSLIRCGCDFCNAIHYLPANSILWAGKLSLLMEGFFGTVSSIILLMS